jgi:hypothetical protein
VEFDIFILNARKKFKLGIRPIMFIPLDPIAEHLLPRLQASKSLSLEPLVHELETLYVDGFEADFAIAPSAISRALPQGHGTTQIRVLLMLITGDHPA